MFQTQLVIESLDMVVNVDNKKKWMRDIICHHYGKKWHNKDRCYRIVGVLEDFKFTKGKGNYKKEKYAAANNVTGNYEAAKDDVQVEQKEDLGGSSSLSQISVFQ